MARAIWSGSISFGLVNVPVKAYTAVHDHEVHFHRLEKGSGARVRNQQISEASGDPVERDDVELGYEIGKGRYVTFEQDELEELRPASTRAIEVTDFVPLEQIDPVFYEHTYWLAPDGEAARRPYGLLLAAMIDQQRVGVGTVVMRTKQYLTAVRPFEGALAMSTMRFADEVVARSDIDALPTRLEKPAPKELGLARQIIDALARDWEPERYHDTYTEELRDLIRRKDEGEDVVVEAPDEDEGAKVVDLMEALQASLGANRSGRRKATTKPARKAGPRKAGAGKAAKKGGATKAAGTKGTRKKTAAKKAAAKRTATKKAAAKKARKAS